MDSLRRALRSLIRCPHPRSEILWQRESADPSSPMGFGCSRCHTWLGPVNADEQPTRVAAELAMRAELARQNRLPREQGARPSFMASVRQSAAELFVDGYRRGLIDMANTAADSLAARTHLLTRRN